MPNDLLIHKKADLEQQVSSLKEQMTTPGIPRWKQARLGKQREALKAELAAIDATLASARDRRRDDIAAKVHQRSDTLAFTLARITSLRDAYQAASKDPSRSEATRHVYGTVAGDLQRALLDIAASSAANRPPPVAATAGDIDFVRATVRTPRQRLMLESAHAMGQQANATPGHPQSATDATDAWTRFRAEMPDIAQGWEKDLGEIIARSAFVNGFLHKPLPAI